MKKKLWKKIIGVLCTVSLAITSSGIERMGLQFGISAQAAETEDGIKWSTNIDGTVTVTGYSGSETVVTIPNIIDGKKVMKIASYSFESMTGLEEVNLPENLESIGYRAFYGCSGLTKINLPEGLKKIDSIAFAHCNGLEEVIIPNSVEGVYDSCFFGCSNLKKVTIGKGITKIANYSFESMTGLEEVNLPENLESIGYRAFYGCSGLTKINLPEGLKKIDSIAFAHCNGLEEVIIPDSVEGVYDSCFLGCSNLKKVTIGKGITKIASYSFESMTGLEEVNLPENLESIGYRAFYGCSGLTKINLPEGLKKIDSIAFAHCNGLEEVIIPDSVEGVYDSCFLGCSNLKKVTIGKGITKIASYSFESMTGLEEVNLPENLESIGFHAFYNCSNIQKLYLSDTITEIEAAAFSGCKNLTLYVIQGSYAEEYAKKNNIPYKYYKLEKVPSSQYCFTFYDADNLSVPTNLKLSYNNQELESLRGKVLFTPVSSQDILYAEYNGNKFSYRLSDFSKGEINTIYIPSSIKSQQFSYLRGNYQGKWYDLLNQKTELEKGSSNNYLAIHYMPVRDSIKTINIYQGKNCIYSTNNTNETIKISIQKFQLGKEISIQTIDADGTTIQRLLPLEIIEVDSETEYVFSGDSFTFTIDENIPLLGGREFSFDLPELPVYLYRTVDTLRVGINIKDDLLKDDKEIKDLRRSIEDVFNEYTQNKEDKIEKLNKYMKEKKPTTNKKGKFEITLIGYGETVIPIDSQNKEASVSVNLIVKCKAGFEVEHNTIIWVIPVTFNVGIDGSIEAAAGVAYNITNHELSGDLTVKGDIGIHGYLGAGFSKLLSGGFYGEAKLGTVYNVLSSKGIRGLQEAYISGEFGLRGYVMGFEGTVPLLNGKYYIYPKTKSAKNLQSEMNHLYDSALYSIDTSEYNNEIAVQPNNDILAENIYSAAAPKIVSLEDKIIMVYRTMAQDRSDGNKAMLMFTVFDKDSKLWSEPKPAQDDGTMDWDFELASDGREVWLVYQNARKNFSSDVTLDEVVSQMNIFVQKFWHEANIFDNGVIISKETGYNYLPTVYAENGNAYFAWVHNENADYFAANTENIVQCRKYEGKLWGSLKTVKTNVNAVTELKSGYVDSKQKLIYTIDDDNNLATPENTLFISDIDGSVSYSESGNVIISGFDRISDIDGFIWWNNGSLKKYQEDMKSVQILREQNLNLTTNRCLSENGFLYFSGGSESERNKIFMLNLSDAASQPVELLEVEHQIDFFDISDGNIVYIDTAAQVAENDIQTISNLVFKEKDSIQKDNLHIENVEVLGDEMSLEKGIPLSVSIKNTNTNVIKDIKVTIADSNGKVYGEEIISVKLASGDRTEFVTYLDSEWIANGVEYIIMLSENSDTRAVEQSSSKKFTVSRPEVELSTLLYINKNGYFTKVMVKNNSPVAASGCVSVKGEDGSVIENIPVYNLGFEESQEILVELGRDYDGQVITAVADCGEEYYLYNNTSMQYLPVMEKTYTPGDVNGDGKVNIKDSALTRRHVAKWKVDIDLDAADVNKDGKVTIKDSALIRRYVAKWNVTLL